MSLTGIIKVTSTITVIFVSGNEWQHFPHRTEYKLNEIKATDFQ